MMKLVWDVSSPEMCGPGTEIRGISICCYDCGMTINGAVKAPIACTHCDTAAVTLTTFSENLVLLRYLVSGWMLGLNIERGFHGTTQSV